MRITSLDSNAGDDYVNMEEVNINICGRGFTGFDGVSENCRGFLGST